MRFVKRNPLGPPERDDCRLRSNSDSCWGIVYGNGKGDVWFLFDSERAAFILIAWIHWRIVIIIVETDSWVWLDIGNRN